MITSFVPSAASVLLTAQHLACAASRQEGPDFSFRQGVGEGAGVCIHGEAFAKRIRPFPWLALLLVVWPQYCWKTTALSSRCSMPPVPDGQLIRSALHHPTSVRSVARRGISGRYSQNFLCLWTRCLFPLVSRLSCFSADRKEAWRDIQSAQQKRAEAGCHGALGKIPAHRFMCSHPQHTQQEIFGFCRISLILCIFIS